MKYKFTLKQLYAYSIMNWEQFRSGIEKVDLEKECSFCNTSDFHCSECNIDHNICGENYEGGTLFDKWFEAFEETIRKTDELIIALRTNYIKIKKEEKS